MLVLYSMKSDYLKELNDKQREAVEHEGSPLLILAGAGSGKTKTLTYKAAHLIDSKKLSPEQVLLVTFTNKAAGEMRKRVMAVAKTNLPNVGTFHSLGAKILRRDGDLIGVPKSFIIYDGQDQVSLVKEIMNDLDIDVKRFKPNSVLYAISEAKQEMIGPETMHGIARGPMQEVVARVYREYQNKLRKYSALDFDDLLLQTVKLLKSSDRTLKRYQNLFQYVFVDEYQDTNSAQYVLTKMLADLHKQLTVVGDASQSIYRWRGADYRNIMKLQGDYPDLTEIRLERNYRSTQNILDAADQVITNNKSHPILSLWTESGAGEKIGLIEARTGKDEAELVIREIDKWRKMEKMMWSDFAILYRTNAQSRTLEESLVRGGIPYVLVGGVKFYERKEVKDVLAYLRIVHNPNDGVSVRRAEKSGKRRLAKLMGKLEEEDYRKYKVADIMAMIFESTGYLGKYDEEVEEDLARIENVRELESLAYDFEDLGTFLENVSLVQAEYYAGEMGNKSDVVTLMTLHAAKGLEFPIVFMVGMEEGLFPHSRSMMDKDELEEERRLCYVGITRAKRKLNMSYAKERIVFGAKQRNTRSRFIEEISPRLFDSIYANASYGSSPPKNHSIKIDALSDRTLDDFLSGDISVEDLLKM